VRARGSFGSEVTRYSFHGKCSKNSSPLVIRPEQPTPEGDPMSLEIHQIASAPPEPAPAAPIASAPNAEVLDAIARHHTTLAADLAGLTDDVIAGARVGSFEAARAELVAWFAGELMPHARSEEAVLYAAGSRLEGTRLLVDAMIAEHRALDLLVTDLDSIHDAFAVAVAAGSAQALFGVHLAKENDLLLPALDTAGAVHLDLPRDRPAGVAGGDHPCLLNPCRT